MIPSSLKLLASKVDTSTPDGQVVLQAIEIVLEYQRDIWMQRQREGIEAAKRRGVYKGRRRRLDTDQVRAIQKDISAGVPKARLARDLGVSRQTLYDALKHELDQQRSRLHGARTRAGLERARAAGKRIGAPTVWTAEKRRRLEELRAIQMSPTRMSEELGVSRASVYRMLKNTTKEER